VTAPQSGEIEVEDQLELRIRKPAGLVRCVLACIEIVVLAVAGVAASATTSGVETDIVDASRRLLFLSHGISARACHPRAITRGSQNQIGRSETGHHPAGG
jgi:hypothetical protein